MTVPIAQDRAERLLQQLDEARRGGKITDSAAENIRRWLTEPRYRDYAAQVAEHIEQEKWKELDDVFWTVIPFGTGGRRGRMYPIGSNAINERTIGESAQGLATYVRSQQGDHSGLSCAIAYDTRHRSLEFARLCAEILVANGFKVYLLEEPRSTPQLSFLVRYKNCSCGIMVTASHNPPTDNAVKVYWSNGGQILPPHDRRIIDCVMQVDGIDRANFDQALAEGRIASCCREADAAYLAELRKQAIAGPRDIPILYSPLHGVGTWAALPALQADGFTRAEVYGPHAEPNGDFPNVPQNVANPENPAVFDGMIAYAQQHGHQLILATDPDCDRLGCAAPVTTDPAGPWRTVTGNQIGVLLADFVLQSRREAGTLTPDHYLVKTLVTTEMVRRIGESYGVATHGDLLVGFKWIGQAIDHYGPENFVFGTEESHGYLVGTYARDKDGAVASMLMAELAATLHAAGQSVHDKLDALYWQHGYHAERLMNLALPGSEGMARSQALMHQFRSAPPSTLAGLRVRAVRDYLRGTVRDAEGNAHPLVGPQGDLVMLDLAEPGNYVAVRPSGTEPKVKFYMFTYVPAELLADLDDARQAMDERLDAMQDALKALAGIT